MCWKRKEKKKPQVKKKPDVKKIYKTTDGYFTGNKEITKPRRVAVIDQRKDDGALSVVKIYSKKNKQGKMYMEGVTLSPQKHNSLTEASIVGNQVHIGVKNGKNYLPIYSRDFTESQDRLTKKEHRTIKRKAGGKNRKNRKTTKKKLKKWKKHFKE